ncbi:hypothetical protein IAT38_005292 [Cryptococcus sp. DSM 104549]
MTALTKTLTALLFVLGTNAQFGPGTSTSSSASTAPSPTESIGCTLTNGEWTCAAARASATGTSTTPAATTTAAASSDAASSGTSTIPEPPAESTGCVLHVDHYHCEGPASGATATASSTIPEPPAESTGCVLHVDHYHCEGLREGYTASSTTGTASPTAPSPTESSNCFWHETHWDCFDTAEEAEEAQSAEDSGECIIHVGHTHGDCSAADLACGAVLLENYNMGLHIGAVFIILITSGMGVMIPIISRWLKKGDIRSEETQREMAMYEGTSSAEFGKGVGWWGNVFFVARHFGTGIIISTAFIHLLYHGFVMFNNECIGELGYESTAPAISMAAAFITFLLDFLGTRYAHKKRDNSAIAPIDSPQMEEGKGSPQMQPQGHNGVHDDGCGNRFDAAFAAEQNHQVLLLEAGIIFHSIMIGVTLGAGGGNGWTTLFIVIIFHQIFEGLALGARIALLEWISKARAIVMGLAFTFITPIGVAIGIGVRKSFSQNGKSSLLSVGILNSISAGILLYTAFKLLSSDFTEGPLRDAKLYKILTAMAAMVAGLIAMSVLGKWA